jgi:predicted TIM-barrel fold metal-dependent hydrolase
MNLKQTVLSGVIPQELRIFDAHAHVGEGEYNAAYLYTLPLEKTLSLSKKIGIGAMAASSFKALTGKGVEGNARLLELCAAYPDELFAYLYYEPRNGDALLAQIDSFSAHPNFIGVKIHPREAKASIETNAYETLFEYCEKRGILILCHTWETEKENNPASFLQVLQRFPKLKLLLGHMGGTYAGCMSSIELAKRFENVYLDINGSIYSQIWIEELAKLAPQQKLIFSTDQVFNDPRIVVGRVLLSDLDDKLKRSILCDNFEAAVGKRLCPRVSQETAK